MGAKMREKKQLRCQIICLIQNSKQDKKYGKQGAKMKFLWFIYCSNKVEDKAEN